MQKENNKKGKNWVAIVGCVTGTIALVWQVFSELKPIKDNFTVTSNAYHDSGGTFGYITVTNNEKKNLYLKSIDFIWEDDGANRISRIHCGEMDKISDKEYAVQASIAYVKFGWTEDSNILDTHPAGRAIEIASGDHLHFKTIYNPDNLESMVSSNISNYEIKVNSTRGQSERDPNYGKSLRSEHTFTEYINNNPISIEDLKNPDISDWFN